jgi:hypothetical protein
MGSDTGFFILGWMLFLIIIIIVIWMAAPWFCKPISVTRRCGGCGKLGCDRDCSGNVLGSC